MERIDHITGVILAGGKSSRMGTNKAFLPFGENQAPLIQSVLQKLSSVFTRVVLSVADRGAFAAFDLPEIIDRYPAIGPMGGIVSMLENDEKRIFCVACDMPYLNTELIRYQCLLDEDAVIPVWKDRWESLHAIYSAALLPVFHDAIERKMYKISDALSKSNVRFVSEREVKKFEETGKCFENVNTPTDYAKLRR